MDIAGSDGFFEKKAPIPRLAPGACMGGFIQARSVSDGIPRRGNESPCQFQ